MTAIREPVKRLSLRARRRDEVARPMPRHGDHKQIMKSACEKAHTKHARTFRELAKI